MRVSIGCAMTCTSCRRSISFRRLIDDPYLFGQIAAANALSDVFAMGARPVTAMNIVGFPDKQLGTGDPARDTGRWCRESLGGGGVIVGGHTVRDAEIKYGLSVTGVVDTGTVADQRGCSAG